MKKQEKKIKEPYEPQDTPKPPQIIEPNSGKKRENPIEDKEGQPASPDNSVSGKTRGPQHLLSEEADIDDETTV